jgi:hypothetical protein
MQAADAVCKAAGSLYSLESLGCTVGSMIELPRACIRSDRIAECANIDFISIGSDTLTKFMFGFSVEDAYLFMQAYIDRNLIAADPFLSLDIHGVGGMIQMAVRRARRSKPGINVRPYLHPHMHPHLHPCLHPYLHSYPLPSTLCSLPSALYLLWPATNSNPHPIPQSHPQPITQVSVIGEHGGDANSIRFFYRIGVDSISCPPNRIPIAKIAAAQAYITETASKSAPAECRAKRLSLDL